MTSTRRSASAAATTAISLPFVGDVERVEAQHFAGARTSARIGMAASESVTPTRDAAANSFNVLDTPPRVGSRMARIPGQASSIARTRPFKGAVSLSRTVSNSIPSRTDMMAMPWSPIVPDTKIWSPGAAALIESERPRGTMPTPVVVMKTPSPLPRSTTFVSPATKATPASAQACRIESTMRVRSATGSPSSRMNAAVRYRGVAPPTARSLTVPWTASLPMSPPGKNSGRTTNESVVMAICNEPTPGGPGRPTIA